MRILFSVVLTCFVSILAQSQNIGVLKGNLQDTLAKQTLKLATINVLDAADSTLITFGLSNDKGEFSIANIPVGKHLLMVNYQSYATYYQSIVITTEKPVVQLGSIYLQMIAKDLGNVTVSQSPITIKNDTIEYNAGSFKTKPNGTVEDVLKKLPGVEVAKDGSIKAQGETVQRVLVDGKRFFGDDPTLATKNLPNDIVDKIQVYDAQSDQSAFTGFDDGNRTKTINITTKKDKRKGYFGKVAVGGGTDGRYENSLNLNRFNNEKQLSIIAQANNVNRQGFSLQDILGVMNSGGGGSMMMMGGGGRGGGANVSQSFLQNLVGGANNNGIRTIWAGGLNMRDKWGKKTDAYGSYFYNNSRIDRIQNTLTENLLVNDSSLFQSSQNNATNSNQNHRFNYNIETNFDSANALIIRPNFTYQNSDNSNETISSTTRGKFNLLNASNAVTTSKSYGYNGNIDATFRHKFKKRGRTISFNTVLGGSENDRTGFSFTTIQRNNNLGQLVTDTINQKSTSDTRSQNISTNVAYTEPITKNQQIEISYAYSQNLNFNNRSVFNFNKASNTHDILVPNLSNNFKNTNTSNRVVTSYRIQTKSLSATAGLGVQFTEIESYNKTKDSTLAQKFINLFPTANLTYTFTKNKTLRVNYRGRTNQPSVSQLQPVIDNSNPLAITMGNPALKQEFVHTFSMFYSKINIFTFSNFFVGVNGNVTTNKIVNAIEYTPVGGTITKPVNLNGAYNITGFVNKSIPIKKLKGNLGFSTNITYLQDVSLVNNAKNFTHNIGVGQTFSFNTNIKEKLDLNFTSTTNFNSATYTLQPQQNANFWTQLLGVDATVILPKGWLWANEFDYTLTRGRSAAFNQNIPIWNMSVAKQIFKKKQGEIKLGVYDLLNQNRSVTRNITDNTIQDVSTNVIRRYFLISFTYNLRKFGGQNGQMPAFMNNMFRRAQRSGGMGMQL